MTYAESINVTCISFIMFLIVFVIYIGQLIYDYCKTKKLLHRMEKLLVKIDKTLEKMDELDAKESIWVCEVDDNNDLGDYPDAIPNQFDNMTGSMNL